MSPIFENILATVICAAGTSRAALAILCNSASLLAPSFPKCCSYYVAETRVADGGSMFLRNAGNHLPTRLHGVTSQNTTNRHHFYSFCFVSVRVGVLHAAHNYLAIASHCKRNDMIKSVHRGWGIWWKPLQTSDHLTQLE
jgi:hypothetical protein